MSVFRRFLVSLAALSGVLTLSPIVAHADDVRDRQWSLRALGILDTHRISHGQGVLVAVADTGVDDRSGELAGAVVEGKEFGEGATGNGKADTDGHGTAVAGLIAGRGLPNGAGILGVAPEATILPVQTVHSEFGGSATNLAAGIEWAVAQGAKVICVAAGTGEYPELKTAVDRAVQADVVVVAAVGNTPKAEHVVFPAKLPGVLAVAGTDRDGHHASISASGPETVLAAPAVDIISTYRLGHYITSDGTSNAAAIVAGVVALVRARYPLLSGPDVIRRLTATAVDKGPPGRDDEYGFGIVNPLAALTATLPPSPPASSPQPGDEPSRGGVTKAAVAVIVLAVAVALLAYRRRRTHP